MRFRFHNKEEKTHPKPAALCVRFLLVPKVTGAIARTNYSPSSIFRGAGQPQTAFIMESAMEALCQRITGPAAEAGKIPTLDVTVGEGDTVRIGDHAATVMTVPGHTQGHIAFHLAEDDAIFTGDTLFAMGCGRLFEGTPADMFANMQRYAMLPDTTSVYCGHEYTQSNGRYALVAEPDNQAIVDRMRDVDALREKGEATVPTTIGLERATNPFLRATTVAELAARRKAKDDF